MGAFQFLFAGYFTGSTHQEILSSPGKAEHCAQSCLSLCALSSGTGHQLSEEVVFLGGGVLHYKHILILDIF